jgi:hypothetical protein
MCTHPGHVQLPAELPAKLAAGEGARSASDVATACHLCRTGDLSASKADQLQGHQGSAAGEDHSDSARRQPTERRRIGKQLHGHGQDSRCQWFGDQESDDRFAPDSGPRLGPFPWK